LLGGVRAPYPLRTVPSAGAPSAAAGAMFWSAVLLGCSNGVPTPVVSPIPLLFSLSGVKPFKEGIGNGKS
jgi:hypothetical protein